MKSTKFKVENIAILNVTNSNLQSSLVHFQISAYGDKFLATANMTGCNPEVYKWCTDSLYVKPVTYLGSMVVVLGIAITLSTIAVDTLYSRILGNIDQVLIRSES